MAVFDKQTKVFDILQPSMTPESGDAGVKWIQNLERQQSSWVTRGGFGSIAILDSKFTTGKEQNTGVESKKIGLDRHLGSYLLRQTSFGHKQILSIFRSNVNTTDLFANNGLTPEESIWYDLNQYRTIYTAFVYDLTTDNHAEFPLIINTAKMQEDLIFRHGNEETVTSLRYDKDYQSWIDAGQNFIGTERERNTDKNDFFWFAELNGVVYFGNRFTGVMSYTPIDPRTDATRQNDVQESIEAHATQDYKQPRSEFAAIRQVSLKQGLFKNDGFTYTTDDNFGRPVAACELDGRLVYAVDNYLFFSDPADVNAIVAGNIQDFPSNIVAVASSMGNLLVWTDDNRTYYYNPAQGDLLSGGRITEISQTVGCLGPNAWINVDGAIFWADKNGFWKNHGNMLVSDMSGPIKVFFEKGISNALTSYYTDTGYPTSEVPPKTFYHWNELTYVGTNISHDPLSGMILFNIPELNITWILDKNAYYIWNYESIAYTVSNTAEVKGIKNMPKPWILTDGLGEIYAVTDVTVSTYDDDTYINGSQTNYFADERSYQILRKGRGGGVDASLYVDYEDKRRFNGEWREISIDTPDNSTFRDNAYFYIDKPIAIPNNTSCSWANTYITSSDRSPMWVPISLVPKYDDIKVATNPTAANYTNVIDIKLRFKFDNTHWTPILNPAANRNYEVLFNLPTERLGARQAYFIGTADDVNGGNQGVWLSDSNGVGSATGDHISIHIDGTQGGFVGNPRLNFLPRYKNKLLMLAFKRKPGGTANDDTYHLGTWFNPGTYPRSYNYGESAIVSGTQTSLGLICWDGQTRALRTAQMAYDTVQSVDWCFAGQEIHTEDSGVLLQARGMSVDVQSSGNATQQTRDPAQSWPYRLFNVVTSTNYKMWAAQLLDYASPAAIIKVATEAIRSRMGTSATQVPPRFAGEGGTGAQSPKWGSVNNSTYGNLLIGDPQLDNIKTSVGVKGDRIQVQMFGHVLSPAEKIRLVTAKLYARIVSGFRRTGRD